MGLFSRKKKQESSSGQPGAAPHPSETDNDPYNQNLGRVQDHGRGRKRISLFGKDDEEWERRDSADSVMEAAGAIKRLGKSDLLARGGGMDMGSMKGAMGARKEMMALMQEMGQPKTDEEAAEYQRRMAEIMEKHGLDTQGMGQVPGEADPDAGGGERPG